MKDVAELLESILDQTTFASHSGASMSPEQLRDAIEHRGWHDEEIITARRAKPNIPDELLSQLNSHLRPLLQEYIDPETDHFGHAFPMDAQSTYPRDRHHRKHIEAFQPNGLLSLACVSAVEDFAKGLIKGAAVIGAERVALLLSGWLQEEPVKYRTSALLNGLPVKEPLAPLDGVRIEPLPLSTDELPPNLPKRSGMSAEDYLGRTVLSIDSAAKPALFRPDSSSSVQIVQANTVGDVDIDTVCQALSLESDSYVDVAFRWNDYQELAAFSPANSSSSWATGNASVKARSAPMSISTDSFTGVTTLEFGSDHQMLDLAEAQLAHTLESLKRLKTSQKKSIAVSRWVNTKDSGEHLVDRFIDLRVALESLYLQQIGNEKYRGEMGLRLSLCGAWHLGVDFEQWKRIRKSLQDAYNKASQAVHAGELDSDKSRAIFEDAQDFCRRGILKMLKEGCPSREQWNDLILGSAYDH